MVLASKRQPSKCYPIKKDSNPVSSCGVDRVISRCSPGWGGGGGPGEGERDEGGAWYGREDPAVGGKSAPLPVGTKLAKFDKNEAPGHWPFRELLGSLMWLSTQTRPDIFNAVKTVARYCSAPRSVHWRAALGILGYVRRTSGCGITFQRGAVGGVSLQVFADVLRECECGS